MYMALFCASAVILLGFIYFATVGLIDKETNAAIEAEIRGLTEQYSELGIDGLTRVIKERSGNEADQGAVYMLADDQLKLLAGDISVWPSGTLTIDHRIRFTIGTNHSNSDGTHEVVAQMFELSGGYHLLVGRDIEDRLGFQRLITDSLLWALAITIVLSMVGGLLMSRNMLRRVDAIDRASRTIMQGDLAQRMPIRGTGDEFDRLAGQLNEMLDQIEQLNIGMRTVVDSVAHDLRGPLTHLKSHIELTLLGKPDLDNYRIGLDTALAAADRIHTTFDALLRIAQAEAGAVAMEDLDLGVLVQGVTDLYEPIADERNIGVDVYTEPKTWITGNRDLLAQAVANLLDNAIKYTPGGGKIKLEVKTDTGHVQLILNDTGPGVAAQDRARVLERFVRLDDSRTTPGSGLGLSLVAAVAKLHRASLELGGSTNGLRVILTFRAALSHS